MGGWVDGWMVAAGCASWWAPLGAEQSWLAGHPARPLPQGWAWAGHGSARRAVSSGLALLIRCPVVRMGLKPRTEVTQMVPELSIYFLFIIRGFV